MLSVVTRLFGIFSHVPFVGPSVCTWWLHKMIERKATDGGTVRIPPGVYDIESRSGDVHP